MRTTQVAIGAPFYGALFNAHVDREPRTVIHVKRAKMFDPVDCWQGWGGAFTPKSPFEVPKKTTLIYVKRAKDKNIAKLFIGVP